MRDHIPDALITAFERQYDSSWNDPQLRNERLAMRYGWAAAMEAKPCLHQIQEPAPATAMDALREAEAALEVAMARILKADPGHSICVTSEAKALVAVRAALAAPAAVAVPDEREAFEKWVENPRLWSLAHQGAQWAAWQARAALAATASVSNESSEIAPSVVAVHMAEVWEQSAADTDHQSTGAGLHFNQGVAEGMRICAKDLRAALAATPAAAPVVLPEPVSDAQIKAVFLANGFTIKEGLTDLKPYVYQAARALLATGGQAQELADTVQTVFDALQDKIDARGPISKGNLQYYVNLLREAFDAAPQAQADARDARLGTARAFIEWAKAQPEDRAHTTIDGALAEFEAHIAAIAAAKGE